MTEKQPVAALPKEAAGDTWSEPKATALLVLADGTVLEGSGLGATGQADDDQGGTNRETHEQPFDAYQSNCTLARSRRAVMTVVGAGHVAVNVGL